VVSLILPLVMGLGQALALQHSEMLRLARASGFEMYSGPDQVKPGARLIFDNRDRALILAVIGSTQITEGSRLIGAHQDSPHIDLKARPIFASEGLVLFKTVYYGGIKKYQWANVPLALIGSIVTTEGRGIDVSIGLSPGDPVFVIPDNAPHSDTDLRDLTYTEVFKGEELDPVAGSIPGETGSVVDDSPLLWMHATFEMSSKVDLWNFYRFMRAFFQS
jgi:aspartyl aminopeptidase